MQKGFVNFAFALFAALLLIGSVFAEGNGTMILNSPPVITGVGGPSSLNAGEAGTWSLSAYDPNGNYLSYSVNWGDGLGQAQQGMSNPTSTATFQHTYSAAGTYTITFTVTDDLGAQTQSSITTTVTGAVLSDQAPTIATFIGPSTLTAGTRGWWSLKVNDQDDSYANYIIQWGDGTSTPSASLVTGLMYNMSFDHIYSNSGTYTATLSVTDAHGTAQAAQASTTTTVSGANNMPDLSVEVLSISTDHNGVTKFMEVTKNLGSASSSGYTLTYELDGAVVATQNVIGLAAGASHSNELQRGMISAGSHTMRVKITLPPGASDANSANDEMTKSFEIAGSNQAPVITSVGGPTSLSTGSTGTWKVSAYDPDGTYISYSVVWGDEGVGPVSGDAMLRTGSSATFQHTYSKAGTYIVIFTVKDSAGATTQSKSSVVVDSSSTNLPPVITGVGGPTEISIGSSGTWKVSAYDPDGKYLNYRVQWGDADSGPSGHDVVSYSTETSATFQHTYSKAGTYKIVFTVTDSAGAETQSTLSVKVTGGSSTSEVYASVGAIPTELVQYETVYVTGKISRGSVASSDSAQTYRVVLSFDNGNEIPKTASAESGTVTSTGSIQTSGQGREEEITLYPGESKEVSAYFTASRLGTNFAKIMVYQKGRDRCAEIDTANGNSEQATRCGNYYTLVASDSTKVYVKESGIPQPPSEGVTIALQKGWNQISVPAKRLEISELAQKCDISTNVWYYNAASKQYEKASYLGAGSIGYWVKANSDCSYTIDSPYLASASDGAFSLKAGWNMIGAPLSATAINNMAGNCKITTGPWNYSPSASQYTYSEKLEPGKGYWVKVAADCTLGGSSDMPPPVPTSVESAQAVTPAASVAQPLQAVHANSAN